LLRSAASHPIWMDESVWALGEFVVCPKMGKTSSRHAHLQFEVQVISDFLEEEVPKRIIIRVLDRSKYFSLSNAETEVLKLKLPFTEPGLQ
jgi:hypothetical protein